MNTKKSLFLVSILMTCIYIHSQSINLKLGLFQPSQKSDLWKINRENLTIRTSDMLGGQFGIELEMTPSRFFSLGLGFSSYSRTKACRYRESRFEDIRENISLRQTSIEATAILYPLGRNRRYLPYFGVGFGIVFWHYSESGKFVIFPEEKIVSGTAETSSTSLSLNTRVGLVYRVSHSVGIVVEGSYRYANGALSAEFEGFENFDLSGFSAALGLNFFFR